MDDVVSDERIIVGRGDKADVSVDDPYVSPIHFSVVMRDGQLLVRDEGSTNGISINGRPAGYGERLVTERDTIRFGHTDMTVAHLLERIRSR